MRTAGGTGRTGTLMLARPQHIELWRRLLQENFDLHLVSNSEQTCKNELLCADVHWSHVALEKLRLCPPMAKRRTTNVLMYVSATSAAFYPRIFKVGRQTDIIVTEPRTWTDPNLYKQNRLVSSRPSVQMLTLFCTIHAWTPGSQQKNVERSATSRASAKVTNFDSPIRKTQSIMGKLQHSNHCWAKRHIHKVLVTFGVFHGAMRHFWRHGSAPFKQGFL